MQTARSFATWPATKMRARPCASRSGRWRKPACTRACRRKQQTADDGRMAPRASPWSRAVRVRVRPDATSAARQLARRCSIDKEDELARAGPYAARGDLVVAWIALEHLAKRARFVL